MHLAYHFCSNVNTISFEGRWTVNGARAAILFMKEPRITRVPQQLLDKIKARPELQDKTLVEHVYSCHAYYLCLANKSKDLLLTIDCSCA